MSFQAPERPNPETIIRACAGALVGAAVAVPGVGAQQALGSSGTT